MAPRIAGDDPLIIVGRHRLREATLRQRQDQAKARQRRDEPVHRAQTVGLGICDCIVATDWRFR